MILSADDLQAFGRQALDAGIAAYQQALTDHAMTVDVPAPTTHSLVETIVNQFDGQYTVTPANTPPPSPVDDLFGRVSKAELAYALSTRLAQLESDLGIKAVAATVADRVAAIEAATAALVT